MLRDCAVHPGDARSTEVRFFVHMDSLSCFLSLIQCHCPTGATDINRWLAMFRWILRWPGMNPGGDKRRRVCACGRCAERAGAVSPRDTRGPAILARACARLGIPLVTFSSDLVFDGKAGASYVESDAPGPQRSLERARHAATASRERPLAISPRARRRFPEFGYYLCC